jgi:hypothetical protein
MFWTYTLDASPAETIYHGSLVEVFEGKLLPAGVGGAKAVVLGRASVDDMISESTDGDKIRVDQGCFRWANGDSIVAADIGKTCYALDDQTVTLSDGAGARAKAGTIQDVDTDGVWVITHLGGVGGQVGYKLFSLDDLREMTSDGDVGNIAAIGGVLASDTTPIRKATTDVQTVEWAAGNQDIVGFNTSLPPDFDGSYDATLELWVSSGTTDLASFTVESTWDGGAVVSDTATDGAASATTHRITATIAKADIPDSPSFVSFTLTPAAHATDVINLKAFRLSYRRKPN